MDPNCKDIFERIGVTCVSTEATSTPTLITLTDGLRMLLAQMESAPISQFQAQGGLGAWFGQGNETEGCELGESQSHRWGGGPFPPTIVTHTKPRLAALLSQHDSLL